MNVPMRHSRRTSLVSVLVFALAGLSAIGELGFAAEEPIEAPNVVPISASLVTSGQPSAAALSRLARQGFGSIDVYFSVPRDR
jgi:hypothetical protein